MQGSEALILEILKQPDSLKMSLFAQKDLALTLRHYSQCALDFSEINSISREVTRALNKADKSGLLSTHVLRELEKSGRLLYDHLLTRPVKERLKNALGVDLILSLDEELINIPWEMLYERNNFLCLNFNLGRVIRTREQAASVRYRSPQGALKMLILANPTNDLKSAYNEGLHIKNQFDRKRSNVHIDFKSTYIDRLFVKKNFCDYDVVHFAGHCEYNPADSKDTGWILNDGKFSAHDILALGSSESLPSLVFSNACYSAKMNPDLIEHDYQEKNYSLASAFIFSGVRHYIGTIRKIEDPISLVFAKEFYGQLIAGKPVGRSMRLARLKLIQEYGATSIPWASYLLYGDPAFTLFQEKIKPHRNTITSILFKYKKAVILSALAAVFISLIGIYLYMWLPSLNPSSYYLFLKSRRLFLAGKNEEVIPLASGLIRKDPGFLAVYSLLADTYRRWGDKENALKYYFEYLLHAQKKRDAKEIAAAYIGIGWTYHLFGEYEKAGEFYQQAITLSKVTGDKLNEAGALEKLAVWYIDKKDDDKALELLTRAAEINRPKQNIYSYKYNLACDYFDMGLVFTNKDDFATAKEFYGKSQLLFEQLKLGYELSDCYYNLGEIHVFEKEYQKALDYYLKGLKLDEEQGNRMGLASDYLMIGELYIKMDALKEAENFLNRAVSLSKEINLKWELADAYYDLGLLYKKIGRKNRVREYWRQAQEIYSQIDPASYESIKKELLALSPLESAAP